MRALVAALLLAGSQASAEEAKGWTFSAYAYTYFVPGDGDYVQPTLTADRDRLHLEARYQYEDDDTGSLWAGYNFGVGEKVTFEGTLMLGGVFGSTDGIAPGYRAALGWSKLEWTSEGEVLFDADESAESFFYAWSELTWAPTERFRFGLVGQRTRVYETDREIQRGVLLGFAGEHVDFATYVFNPDDDSPTVVLALGLNY